MDTVALSAKEIRCTAFSVTFGPRFLILVLLYRLLCSTSKSCAMLFSSASPVVDRSVPNKPFTVPRRQQGVGAE